MTPSDAAAIIGAGVAFSGAATAAGRWVIRNAVKDAGVERQLAENVAATKEQNDTLKEVKTVLAALGVTLGEHGTMDAEWFHAIYEWSKQFKDFQPIERPFR